MNFKFYDILSSLVPGFIILTALMYALNIEYNNDYIIPYTAFSFLIGYIVNAICSWLESFYFWTWRGKPSNQLLNGKGMWKIHFYEAKRVKNYLIEDVKDSASSDDKLFHEAMKQTNGGKNSRVDDFNAHYAFSRSLLTTTIMAIAFTAYKQYDNWIFYIIALPILFIVWFRCKQRAYYFAREILNEYLKSKRTAI